jgi:hypothetical protein
MVFLLEFPFELKLSVFARPSDESDGQADADKRQCQIDVPAMQLQCRDNSRKPRERNQECRFGLRHLPIQHKRSSFCLLAGFPANPLRPMQIAVLLAGSALCSGK